MADLYFAQKRIIGFKQETVPGTMETLDATSVVEKCWGTVNALNLRVNKIPLENPGGFGNGRAAIGDAIATLEFWHYAHGKGATGLPGWFTPLMEAAGMPVTAATATTSDDFADMAGLSAAHWIDGLKRVGRGFAANLKMTLEPGRPWRLDWTMTGAYQTAPSTEALPTGTYDNVTPPRWQGAGACTLAGQTDFRIPRIELDLGNVVERLADENSVGGYLRGLIRNRYPRVTMTPVVKSDYDWFAQHTAGSEVDLECVAGSDANNTLTLTVNDMESIDTPEDADDNGLLANSLVFEVHGDISLNLA